MSNDIQPEIRFPGFTEAWEQRKFECLLDKKDGVRSFPNKRILRNNLCLPACKLLYLDKREKNFLLTDIISDIIIVRN